jgi:hypothetical protein
MQGMTFNLCHPGARLADTVFAGFLRDKNGMAAALARAGSYRAQLDI